MVAYIRSDLDFILAQIKIAEKHAPTSPTPWIRMPRRSTGRLAGQVGSVPTYKLSMGPAHRRRATTTTCCPARNSGAPRTAVPRTAGPGLPAGGRHALRPGSVLARRRPCPRRRYYNPPTIPSSMVFDSSLRTISNLIVDQTLGNPAAILKGLERGGVDDASWPTLRSCRPSTPPSSPPPTPSIRPAS